MDQAMVDQDAAFETLADNIDMEVRKIEAKLYRCALSCCDNEELKSMDRENCIQHCMLPSEKAQQYVEVEVQKFNDAMANSVKECEEQYQDVAIMVSGAAKAKTEKETDNTINRLREDYENCVVSSIQRQTKLIPNLQERILTTLQKGNLQL